MMGKSERVPLDLLALLLLISRQLLVDAVHVLLVLPLFLYIVLEMWHPLAAYASLPTQFDRARLTFLLRLGLLWTMIAGSVIVPTAVNIYRRMVVTPEESGYSEAYGTIHDGALQVEYALAFLRDGKNPYVERYQNTPFEHLQIPGRGLVINPAVDYFAYLPGYLVVSFPVERLLDLAGLPYDQRWVYLAAYLGLLILLPTLVKRPTHKLALLAAVALNPLVSAPVNHGMNDILVLLAIVTAVAALTRRHFALSAVAFGLACALKQSAWFVAPFYALTLFGSLPGSRRSWQTAKYVGGALLITAVIVGPFALWSPADFITDVFAYPGGGVDNNWPIGGYTIGVLLLGAGAIGSPLDPFPFWILQLLLGAPLLAWLLIQQWRDNRPGMMLLYAGAFIFGLGLVSRFFHLNYVGFVAALMSIGLFLNLQGGADKEQT